MHCAQPAHAPKLRTGADSDDNDEDLVAKDDDEDGKDEKEGDSEPEPERERDALPLPQRAKQATAPGAFDVAELAGEKHVRQLLAIIKSETKTSKQNKLLDELDGDIVSLLGELEVDKDAEVLPSPAEAEACAAKAAKYTAFRAALAAARAKKDGSRMSVELRANFWAIFQNLPRFARSFRRASE